MGGKAQAPDTGPMAAASEESARIMAGLGQQQLDFSKLQYAENKPLMDRIVNSQMAMQDEQLAQGRDYYSYMKDTYRPLEQEMVDKARSYNTEANREQMAQQAAADAGLAFQNTKAASARSMASMGVNPNSGRYAGAEAASNLGLSAMKANAMTGTRRQAEGLGDAKMMDAIGMGRGLPGASSGAYSAALGAGNAAGQNSQMAGNQYMQGLGQAAGTYNMGFQNQMQGLGSILNAQTSIYNNSGSPWASLLGAGMGMMKFNFPSSKALKDKVAGVNAEDLSRQVAKIPVDRWRYKPGVADEGEHVGPYAEDLAKLGGGDGRSIDVISALGVNLAAAKGLGQRVAKLERQRGKAHA
jgi:hypothetical protein